MKASEIQQQCKYYEYCPQYYRNHFNQIFEFMKAHPSCTRVDVIKYAGEH